MSQEVYPIGIYACLAQLVVVFLITDLCRYKPLIIALGLSGIVTWAMLLWTKSLLELQVLEVSMLSTSSSVTKKNWLKEKSNYQFLTALEYTFIFGH